MTVFEITFYKLIVNDITELSIREYTPVNFSLLIN